jgi:hypothetical protein
MSDLTFSEGIQLQIDVTSASVRPNRDKVEPRRLFPNRRRSLVDQWACSGRADVRATIQRTSWV